MSVKVIQKTSVIMPFVTVALTFARKEKNKMATPRKSDKEYPGYLADQTFILTAREEELLSRTVHPEQLEAVDKCLEMLTNKVETLEVRFNKLLTMLHSRLEDGFKLLEIKEK